MSTKQSKAAMAAAVETDWAKDVGAPAYAVIVEMVSAIQCDYDRLEELREEAADYAGEDGETEYKDDAARNVAWAMANGQAAEELAALEEAAAAGRAAVAIDWGAWRDKGAATSATLVSGMGSIATADGFAALDRILDSGVAQAAVLPMDRVAMRKAGVEPALLRETGDLPDAKPAAAPAAPASVMPPEDRRAWLQDRIAAECASMLAIRGTIELRRPLHEMGLDSLAALELRNRLGRLAGVILPASLLFDYPTVAALTDHIAAACFGLATAQAASKPLDLLPEDDLEAASDEELDAALSAFSAIYGDAE